VYGRSGSDVERLDGGKLIKHSPRSGSGRQRFGLGAQRGVKAIGQEVKQRVDENPDEGAEVVPDLKFIRAISKMQLRKEDARGP
jgi:hypothetical protein